MERKLHDAAVEGDVITLLELLQQDKLVLDRYMVSCFTETPLHLSAMLGHVQFTKEILRLKPQLADELNSQRCTPLHLASAKGYVEIVKELLSVSPEMCLIRQQDGLTPLHIAVVKGRVSIMRELLRAKPDAAYVSVDEKSTILHSCVRHNQLDGLKVLMETIGHDDEFLNSKDAYGNTILHLAVADKRVEMITYLITSTTIKANEINLNGFTAMDILAQSQRDVKDIDIGESLRSVGALKAENLPPLAHGIGSSKVTVAGLFNHQTTTNKKLLEPQDPEIRLEEFPKMQNMMWTKKKLDALMVAATIITTMAFQVGINPPGGVWQETKEDTHPEQTAGLPVMKDTFPIKYKILVTSNTVGFVGSLSIILLLISGLPIRHKFFVWVLMVIMWVTISAMAITYGVSIASAEGFFGNTGLGIILGWILLMILLLLIHFIRLIVKVVRWSWRLILRRRRASPGVQFGRV